MALTTCRDCEQEVSDLAPACIHCGCPRAVRSTPAPAVLAAVNPSVPLGPDNPLPANCFWTQWPHPGPLRTLNEMIRVMCQASSYSSMIGGQLVPWMTITAY